MVFALLMVVQPWGIFSLLFHPCVNCNIMNTGNKVSHRKEQITPRSSVTVFQLSLFCIFYRGVSLEWQEK